MQAARAAGSQRASPKRPTARGKHPRPAPRDSTILVSASASRPLVPVSRRCRWRRIPDGCRCPGSCPESPSRHTGARAPPRSLTEPTPEPSTAGRPASRRDLRRAMRPAPVAGPPCLPLPGEPGASFCSQGTDGGGTALWPARRPNVRTLASGDGEAAPLELLLLAAPGRGFPGRGLARRQWPTRSGCAAAMRPTVPLLQLGMAVRIANRQRGAGRSPRIIAAGPMTREREDGHAAADGARRGQTGGALGARSGLRQGYGEEEVDPAGPGFANFAGVRRSHPLRTPRPWRATPRSPVQKRPTRPPGENGRGRGRRRADEGPGACHGRTLRPSPSLAGKCVRRAPTRRPRRGRQSLPGSTLSVRCHPPARLSSSSRREGARQES